MTLGGDGGNDGGADGGPTHQLANVTLTRTLSALGNRFKRASRKPVELKSCVSPASTNMLCTLYGSSYGAEGGIGGDGGAGGDGGNGGDGGDGGNNGAGGAGGAGGDGGAGSSG